MVFTPQELRLVERLRRQERNWPRDRWILLVTGVFVFLAYGYLLVRMLDIVELGNLGDGDALFFAFFWPKCLLMFYIAGFLVAWAIRDWRGNTNRVLLLKLLDAQQNESENDSTKKH